MRSPPTNLDVVELIPVGNLEFERRSPDQALDELRALAELGFDHVIVYAPDLDEPGQVELLAELARLAAPVLPNGPEVPRN